MGSSYGWFAWHSMALGLYRIEREEGIKSIWFRRNGLEQVVSCVNLSLDLGEATHLEMG